MLGTCEIVSKQLEKFYCLESQQNNSHELEMFQLRARANITSLKLKKWLLKTLLKSYCNFQVALGLFMKHTASIIASVCVCEITKITNL